MAWARYITSDPFSYLKASYLQHLHHQCLLLLVAEAQDIIYTTYRGIFYGLVGLWICGIEGLLKKCPGLQDKTNHRWVFDPLERCRHTQRLSPDSVSLSAMHILCWSVGLSSSLCLSYETLPSLGSGRSFLFQGCCFFLWSNSPSGSQIFPPVLWLWSLTLS